MGKLIKMTIGLCLLCAGLAQATLVYKADFESYTNGQNVVYNNTGGSNDTFSSIVNATTYKAFNGSSVGMVDGLSLKTTKATTGNVTTVQSYLGQQSSFVLSFDFYSPNQSIAVGMLRDSSVSSAITFGVDSGTAFDNQLVRITAVANYSGTNITLPSTSLGVGGVLTNTGYIVYYKIGTNYTSLIYNKNTNYSNASGFRLVTPFDATVGGYTLIDNIGVWDSFTDTAEGEVSVLALNPGAKVEPPAVVFRSGQDLGWTNGENISTQLTAFLEIVASGDELVLEHRYVITSNYTVQIPDNFTLSANNGGGLEVTVAAYPASNPDLLQLGNGTTLRNLTIIYTNTPPLGGSQGHGALWAYKAGITASGKDNIRIENCRLEGSITHHMKFSSCDNLTVSGCHILGGYWTTYITDCRYPIFKRNLWELCQGDGIKTGLGDIGSQSPFVEECVFQDNGRDGIDTTGGWKDGIVFNCIFRRCHISGIDLKQLFESNYLFNNCETSEVLIDSCRFTDCPDAVVTTTMDTGFTPEGGEFTYILNTTNCHEAAAHDVDIDDCIIENTEASVTTRLLLCKDSHDIRWSNAQFWGKVVSVGLVNLYDTYGGSNQSEAVSDALNYNIAGTLGATNTPGPSGVTSSPWIHGPRPYMEAVAHWALDDLSGSMMAQDSSGLGNDGALEGNPVWSQGVVNGCLDFDGNDQVTAPDDSTLDISNRLTICAWVYLEADDAGRIIEKYASYMLERTAGEVRFYCYGLSDPEVKILEANLPLNTWTHLAGRYDGSTIRIYVNGVLEKSESSSGSITLNSGVVKLGYSWTGKLDEAMVFNRALSDAEIAALAEMP